MAQPEWQGLARPGNTSRYRSAKSEAFSVESLEVVSAACSSGSQLAPVYEASFAIVVVDVVVVGAAAAAAAAAAASPRRITLVDCASFGCGSNLQFCPPLGLALARRSNDLCFKPHASFTLPTLC